MDRIATTRRAICGDQLAFDPEQLDLVETRKRSPRNADGLPASHVGDKVLAVRVASCFVASSKVSSA